MQSEPKTKLVPALLIQVPAETIQQATILLAVSKGSFITLMATNGECIGIDTATNNSRILSGRISPERAPARKTKVTLKSITPELVYGVSI